MKKFIDPPMGYQYGFPKEIPEDTNSIQFLIDNGYPQSIIDELGNSFFCRYWYEPDLDDPIEKEEYDKAKKEIKELHEKFKK